jgi:hypothetical protein
MKIHLDKIELNSRINALGLKSHYHREHCDELYYDTDLEVFFVITECEKGSKYTGKIMLPACNVAAAQVSRESVPKHQPIGTPDERDTPSGKKRKHRTLDTAKSEIAKRAEAREASKKSQD